jgi:hypothetical protein
VSIYKIVVYRGVLLHMPNQVGLLYSKAVNSDLDVKKSKETTLKKRKMSDRQTSSVSVAFPLQAAVRRSPPAKGKTL